MNGEMGVMKQISALAAACVLMTAGAVQAGPVTRNAPVLSADGEAQMVLAAQKACRAQGYRVAVAIADRHGLIRALLTDDGVGALDIASATHKAKGAAVTGRPTAFLAKIPKEAQAYVDLIKSVEPDVALIGGGMPLVVDGQVIGAIGIGGAPNGDADEMCAQAALALLPKAAG
ncbi:heme-binding protein [Novosphingobium umbonatum]|uniref:Heme-binding protein n=2 Tax=Novosphingobium umbonatum TaxID=1908524 RepID=A0A437N0M4_9SPHN|nr:heme-binding protein [Novosphingobium umbonatum]